MSNETNLNTFPSTKAEALTMLYLQNQDLSDITPEELAKKYSEVFSEIREALKTGKKQGWMY
ncbi:hypothetical protein [Enterococcus dispar]